MSTDQAPQDFADFLGAALNPAAETHADGTPKSFGDIGYGAVVLEADTLEPKAEETPKPRGDIGQGPRGTPPSAGPERDFENFLKAHLR
jgi:hypothetical protein